MKRFLMAVALSCVLSTTALAGNIPTSGITSPPPPPEEQTTSPGNIPTSGYAQPQTENPLLSVLLTLIGIL